MTNRASIFDEDDAPPVDLSDFAPGQRRKPIEAEVMRGIAEGRGFTSREPDAAPAPTVASTPAPAADATSGRPVPVRRRRATREVRAVQLNVRITPSHQARFIACLDQLGEGYSQADGIELAIEALEASLAAKSGAQEG
jgi:hypothetical protein